MSTRCSALVLAVAAVLAAGCEFTRTSGPTAPSASSTTGTTTTTTGSYVGTWASGTSTNTATLPDSCGNIEWKVTSQTATTIAGEFTAKCGAFAVSGTGSGTLNGQDVTVSVSGSGNGAGLTACAFSLNGAGTLVGDTLPITYTGTTCLGPVKGTETLRRSTPAPAGTLDPPTPVSPAIGATVTTTRPTFVLANSTRSGSIGSVSYLFEVTSDVSFTSDVRSGTVAEQSNQTSFGATQALDENKTYYWRAQATDGPHTSAWSAIVTFYTPAPAPPAPSYPNNGPDVIRHVERTYPERLVGGISLAQRKENMAFLRDRIIETGICGGMDLALNLKRGGPELSIDYITYNKAGRWIGVDIGYDYDNTSTALRLTWGEAPDDPYMTPKAYLPRPSCR